MYNIFLIGDSLTDLGFRNGWGAFLKQWYKNKAIIHNKSICNYTSLMIKNVLKELINNHTLDICTILLGSNDCYNSNLYVSPDNYKHNILYIIDQMRKINPTCIILLITPPLCKIHKGIFDYVGKIYQIIGERPHITLIDLHHGTNKFDYSDLHTDGLHLNANGNYKIFNKIKDAIETYLPFISPNSNSNSNSNSL